MFPVPCAIRFVCLLIFHGSFGLPTRAHVVSEFMIRLEKMGARSGEVSQSACALLHEDMCRLYNHCIEAVTTQDQSKSPGEQQWGAICYVDAFEHFCCCCG